MIGSKLESNGCLFFFIYICGLGFSQCGRSRGVSRFRLHERTTKINVVY